MGVYAVVSQTIAHVDIDALKKNKRLADVSADVGYQDEAGIIEVKEFKRYLLPESNPWHQAAAEWYSALPPEVAFVIVHRAEWESGLSD